MVCIHEARASRTRARGHVGTPLRDTPAQVSRGGRRVRQRVAVSRKRMGGPHGWPWGSPIDSRPSGNVTALRPTHCWKARSPIASSPSGRSSWVMPVQPWKARLPIALQLVSSDLLNSTRVRNLRGGVACGEHGAPGNGSRDQKLATGHGARTQSLQAHTTGPPRPPFLLPRRGTHVSAERRRQDVCREDWSEELTRRTFGPSTAVERCRASRRCCCRTPWCCVGTEVGRALLRPQAKLVAAS